MNEYWIAPSILSADFARLGEEVDTVRECIDETERPIRLEVDGGVHTDNIRTVAEAGADTFVAGSAIFSAGDYAGVIARMRARLAKVRRSSRA